MVKRLFLILSIATLISCNQKNEETTEEAPQQAVTLVNISEFHELMEKQEDLQIVDVRTPKEYDLAKIPGAINIDYWSDDFVKEVGQLDKTKPIAVYCAAGRRSAKAAAKLKEMGFKHIYDLDGGMRAWHTGPPLAN